MRLTIVLVLSILIFTGWADSTYSYTGIPVMTEQKNSRPLPIEGKWRGEFEIRPGLKVPFVFEFAKGKDNKPAIYFLNGDEKFEGGSVKQVNDSVIVSLDQFDNEFALKLVGDELSGELRKQNSNTPGTPLTAKKNLSYRFKDSGSSTAVADVSGTYDILFKAGNGTEEKAVGLFTQEGNKLKGTFLRITGDSRYLEGTVDGNKFQLSSFIGSSPSYYKGQISSDGKLTGEAIGSRSSQVFTGVPNENAALPDASTLTLMKQGYSTLDFSFPDADGKLVSLKDEKFRNKIVIVTIGGTWCPNCIDEANFLSPWYKKNKSRGIEAVSIHYERQTDPVFVKKALDRFREKYDIGYAQVFGGKADKQAVAASLPALNTFLSFPTMILVDRQGKVAKIHTGFSGPATGKYYDEFVKEFNHDIDELVKK
ncbi:peroxiredoxin family protein [Flavitalea sp.]|nr:TlpA disulfide reductase family protein [Flavitalea sp.]